MRLAVLLVLLAALATPRADASWRADPPGPLIEPARLLELLGDRDLAILDLRFDRRGSVFEDGHVPGAIAADYLRAGWRTRVAGVVGQAPPEDALEALLRRLGLSGDELVVLIAAGSGPSGFGAAARAYWTLRYAGHPSPTILAGGHAAWIADPARPIERGAAAPPEPGDFEVDLDRSLLASAEDVEAASAGALIVDARPRAFFEGEASHPAARAAGRIPGARWAPPAALTDAAARMPDLESLAALIPETEGPTIAYCNTGHWASIAWFVASELLGRDDASLYDGSMVDWTRDQSRPVATGPLAKGR